MITRFFGGNNSELKSTSEQNQQTVENYSYILSVLLVLSRHGIYKYATFDNIYIRPHSDSTPTVFDHTRF